MRTEIFYEQRRMSLELRLDAALFNKALLLCRQADDLLSVDFADASLSDEEAERRLQRFDFLSEEIKKIVADLYGCGDDTDDGAHEFGDIADADADIADDDAHEFGDIADADADIADDDAHEFGDGFIGSVDAREFLDFVEEFAEFEDKISFALECLAEQIREYARFRERARFPAPPADEDKYDEYLQRFETVDKVRDFVVTKGQRQEALFGEDYFERYKRISTDFVTEPDEVDDDDDAPVALPEFITAPMWRAMRHALMCAVPQFSRDGRDHVPYLLNFFNISAPAAETLLKEYINRQTKKVFLAVNGEEDEQIAAAIASAAAERYEKFVIRKHERITRRRVFIPKY